MKQDRAGVVFLAVALVPVACGLTGTGAGGMACGEFNDLSMDERVEAFADAVDDRGYSYAGPEWQEEMRVATASSHCGQRPDDTLDDALDFVGVPQ